MPIPKRWSTATRSKIEADVPPSPGVYELRCFGQLCYIGHSSNLQRRLLTHLSQRDPNKFRVETCPHGRSKRLEDEHLSRYEDRHGELPPWNRADTRSPTKGLLARLLGR